MNVVRAADRASHPVSASLLWILFGTAFAGFVVWNLVQRGLFEYIGIDYRLWYSSATIARAHGFQSIYDVDLQARNQSPLFQDYARKSAVSMPFWPLPLPYLSAFVLPMLVFTLVPPVAGFVLWSLFNLVATWAYLYSFGLRNNYHVSPGWIFGASVALPMFLNVIFGNVNLWLLVAFGEAITALRRGRDFTSGIWLAGLLLKPQTLLVLIPGLLLARRYRVLAGALTGGLLLAMVSFAVSGAAAFSGPYETIMHWPQLLGESGMSLSALSINLSRVVPGVISKMIWASLSLMVLAAALWLWLPGRRPLSAENLELSFLAAFAGACILSPHSNVHMALPMLAPGLALYATNRISSRLALAWTLIPTEIFLVASVFSIGAAHVFGGMSMLAGNLTVLFWIVWNRASLGRRTVAP